MHIYREGMQDPERSASNPEGIREPLWTYPNDPPWDLRLGERVWDLHLALVNAAAVDSSMYVASSHDARSIREDASHREEGSALTLILATASPSLPRPLVEQAQRVAKLVWPTEPAEEVEADVLAWLKWQPGSGEQPPYRT